MFDGSRDAVAVVGLGYVGLPLSLVLADADFEVTGIDVDEARVASLRAGQSYVNDVSDDRLQAHLDDRFVPTTEWDAIREVDAVSICVPTPLRKTGHPNVSYVVDAAGSVAERVTNGTLVILESTVYPGATEEIVAGELEERGFTVGEDVFVAFSPERLDPGNEQFGPRDIPKVIGGVTPVCTEVTRELYGIAFDEIVEVQSSAEAELVKLLENTFRSVNIAFINELAKVADELDVDIWRAIDAAATKPFGFMPFYPGPGLGGHCIPNDPQYLSWKANQQGVDIQFIELADQINREMPRYVIERLVRLLNERAVAPANADVLVVGAAYKPNVSDTRESPALDVISLLQDYGASVAYHDPYVPELEVDGTEYESVPLDEEVLAAQDCIVVVTAHDRTPLQPLAATESLVFDTRNALEGFENAVNVVRL